MHEMTREDWERIVHALSQFKHNPRFELTWQKAIEVLRAI